MAKYAIMILKQVFTKKFWTFHPHPPTGQNHFDRQKEVGDWSVETIRFLATVRLNLFLEGIAVFICTLSLLKSGIDCSCQFPLLEQLMQQIVWISICLISITGRTALPEKSFVDLSCRIFHIYMKCAPLRCKNQFQRGAESSDWTV